MMSYRCVSLSHAYMAVVGGLLLLIVPNIILEFIGLNPSTGTVFVSRLYGLFLIGLAAAIFSTQSMEDENVPLVLVTGNALVDMATTLLFVQATLSGLLNAWGYLFAAMFLLNLVSWLVVLVQFHSRRQTARA